MFGRYDNVQQQLSDITRLKLVRFEDDMLEWVILPRVISAATPGRPASLETEYVLQVKLMPDSDDVESIVVRSSIIALRVASVKTHLLFQLIPDNVPIDDICANIRKLSAMENLLYELKCRINNSLKRRTEISALARRYAPH